MDHDYYPSQALRGPLKKALPMMIMNFEMAFCCTRDEHMYQTCKICGSLLSVISIIQENEAIQEVTAPGKDLADSFIGKA